ncbi:hypothetical protein GCM10027594_13310 [Hymenobacter agri]
MEIGIFTVPFYRLAAACAGLFTVYEAILLLGHLHYAAWRGFDDELRIVRAYALRRAGHPHQRGS